MEQEFYTANDLCDYCNNHLPLEGEICKVEEDGKSDYYYVKLAKEWDDFVPSLVKACEGLFKYEKKIETSVHKLIKTMKEKGCISDLKATEGKFYACPSGVGMHISVDKNKIGEKVKFKIERVIMYENQKMGFCNSFDKSKYVCHWIALRVEFEDQSVQLCSSTHVSIAAFGFEGTFKFEEKTKNKKKK